MQPPTRLKHILARLPTGSTAPFCPTEIRETIPVAAGAGFLERVKRYSGVGFLISVGYMDPGNWATDIQAGSQFGYSLLCVILLSSLIAMLLQTLCVRVGMASRKDLATLCHEHFPPMVNLPLWAFAQIAIIACDFAEVLGGALALKLLFGLPLEIGILLTAFDTIIVLLLQGKGLLKVEAIIISLVLIISASFFIEIIISKPDMALVASELIPDRHAFQTAESWLVAISILGATVMPHNLYLHTSVVQTRKIAPTDEARSDAIRILTYDILATLGMAFFVNAAILVVAASVFHFSGHSDIASIEEAHQFLAPLLGTSLASIIFAVALFASGQSSTLTGTMAGQVILQGFLKLRIPCWQQRFFTRLSSVLPAYICIVIYGEKSLDDLLVMSQVVLSMQLPFAVVPLIMFSRNQTIMGRWIISKFTALISWAISAAIIAANLFLIYQMF